MTYEWFGLFDKQNLEFAECEDADLSLRLRAAGRGIHAQSRDLQVIFLTSLVCWALRGI